MATQSPAICIICKESDGLKSFQEDTWDTVKVVASRRKSLESDKHSSTTDEIYKVDGPVGQHYHSACLRSYNAVKKKAQDEGETSEPPSKVTRSNVNPLPTRTRGVLLGNECIFCGKKKARKVGNKYEPLRQCLTTDGNDAIVIAAKRKGDSKIMVLGDDLIAREAKYHNNCRRDYTRTNTNEEEQTSTRKKHADAFLQLSMFIESQVIQKKMPILSSVVLDLYKKEFLSVGGTQEEIDRYTMQSLILKLKERFPDITIDKMANKSGNIIFPSSMTLQGACAKLTGSNEMMETIRSAAMILRTEILSIESNPML